VHVGRAHKLAVAVILVGGITRVAILAAALEWVAARLSMLRFGMGGYSRLGVMSSLVVVG
jgi:hypothetical protein